MREETEKLREELAVGNEYDGIVSGLSSYWFFVTIGGAIEGLVHISELSTKRVSSPEEVCKVGDSIKAEVISIDQDARKVGLSARLATLREQNGDVSEYVKKAAAKPATIGDLFADQLKDLQQNGDNQ